MLSRRQFLKLVAYTTSAVTFSESIFSLMAEAFGGTKKPPLIWLETTSCAGNILSTLNSFAPKFQELLQDSFSLIYSNTLMAAEGSLALQALEQGLELYQGEYILVVEGSISTKKNGLYTVIGHGPDGTPYTALEQVKTLAVKAKYVVAAGTCASFGGPFSAHPNPAGVKPLHQVVPGQVINVPGCPVHPDWLVGTIAHLLLYGVPNLDAFSRPTMFYSQLIHDKCSRRTDFENAIFANKPGDTGCMYKLGCKGPVTYSDCPTRQWIGQHNNWPVEANSPCIGCVSPNFPEQTMPFFKRLPDMNVPFGKANIEKIAIWGGVATAVGIGAHLTANVLTGRLGKQLIQGTGEIPTATQKCLNDPTLTQAKPIKVRKRIRIIKNYREVPNVKKNNH